MRSLPSTSRSLLVRTDFSDDEAWRALLDRVSQASDDGFRAYVEPFARRRYDQVDWSEVRAAVPISRDRPALLFVADRVAQVNTEHPILVVDIREDRQPFRCSAEQLWSVENNLNISNMDWEDFTDALMDDGVFRGF
ncbi:MAG: hypothetical protein IT189_06670 [Microbacteriaceae bacterium]|nr:hypothetical protein [Microbacteriaceae bacterium]